MFKKYSLYKATKKQACLFLAILMMAAAVGCGAPDDTGANVEDAATEAGAVQTLMELTDCNEKTAQSLYDTLLESDIPDVGKIELVDDDAGYILQIEAADGSLYYVCISSYHFIEEIYRDSLDGERIYHAIE